MSVVASPPAPEKRQRHSLKDLYHERTHYEFIERSWRWALLSGTLILISLVAFGVKGLNLGIDFEGGTQWQFTKAQGGASVSDVRSAIEPLGLGDAKVLIIGDNGVRVQSEDLSDAESLKVKAALAKYAGLSGCDVGGEQPSCAVTVKTVSPTWGDKVSSKALTALIVFFFVIAAYLTFRFEWRMALAAIVAVVHDIIITVGVYAVTGFEVTPATVVAFLTILGFSLYDTVVVFDKVKDNTGRVGTVRGDTYSSMVNRSLNQVLMRSINTSIVALLPVASLLFVGTYAFGGLALRDFALALFVGLITGAYSSIFVATPVLAWLKERQPRYRALRERAVADLAKAKLVAPVPPVVAGEPTDVPVDGEDIDPGDDLPVDDVVPVDRVDAPAPAPTARKAPTPPSAPSAPYGTTTASRGSANPRGRQQRGKKKKR